MNFFSRHLKGTGFQGSCSRAWRSGVAALGFCKNFSLCPEQNFDKLQMFVIWRTDLSCRTLVGSEAVRCADLAWVGLGERVRLSLMVSYWQSWFLTACELRSFAAHFRESGAKLTLFQSVQSCLCGLNSSCRTDHCADFMLLLVGKETETPRGCLQALLQASLY